MKISILNGNPSPKNIAFDSYLEDLQSLLAFRGHTCENLTLRQLEAGYCTGCWGCWVRTPGKCVFDDDSHFVCGTVINSDFVLCASPLLMGYVSAVLKKFMDKLIPLVHPYITVDKGEAHHRRRYAKTAYPTGGLLLEMTPDSDEEDIAIIAVIHARTMLNLKSRNAFTMLTRQPIEEVANAILRD
jgi:multimeric flavodoxin WrbA